MDPGALHCYIDSKYPRNLGLPVRPAGQMSVITAGTKHPPETRYQIWLNGRLRGATGNYVDITGWYTLFDLKGAYDLIVGKNWHSATPHLVDSDNILHLLEKGCTSAGQPPLYPNCHLLDSAHIRGDIVRCTTIAWQWHRLLP